MTDAKDNINNNSIAQLLSAIKPNTEQQEPEIPCEPFDWHKPRYFNLEQLEMLKKFADKIAQSTAENFEQVSPGKTDVTVQSLGIDFGGRLQQKIDQKQNYYLTCLNEQNAVFGCLVIPPQTTTAWLTLLLGQNDSEKESNQPLSSLEESLLTDIASAITDALAQNTQQYFKLKSAEKISSDTCPQKLQDPQEFCLISLQIEKTEQEHKSTAEMLIPCCNLEKIAGKQDTLESKATPKQNADVILSHLQQMLVSVTVRLGSTSLSFNDTLGLGNDDIIVLEKTIHKPIELVVENKIIFTAYPAQSEGRLAVVISQSADQTQQALSN